jgi:hypothetical protein
MTRSCCQQTKACCCVLVISTRRDVRCDHPIHHSVGHFQNSDRTPQLAERSGSFEPDIATTNDDRSRTWPYTFRNTYNIRDITEIVHAPKAGARTGQLPRGRSQAKQRPVVYDFLAVRQGNAVLKSVKTGCTNSQFEVDLVLIAKKTDGETAIGLPPSLPREISSTMAAVGKATGARHLPRRRRPLYPSRRSVSIACAPDCPPPTMRIVEII